MSDGGEESKREINTNTDPETDSLSRRFHPDEYGRAVAKVAVAQICEVLGFEAVKQSCLEALSDIAVQFICDLGKSASSYANLAARSEVNLFDIVKGLQDFSSNSGFSGNSKMDYQSVLNEIEDFVGTFEETPFAHPIPQFPVIKFPQKIPTFSEIGEEPSGKHIPTWLPAFPDPHTYIHTPIWNERKTDPRTDKLEQVKQRRKAERSLLGLQQRLLLSNRSAGPTSLAPPVPASEEEEKKQFSVMDTFSPAIDGLKGIESDSIDSDHRVVSEKRPVVQFKLKFGKKMLVEDLDVNLRSRMNERRSSLFGRDDDKDDKKRKAELILRQSMENHQEMSHNM